MKKSARACIFLSLGGFQSNPAKSAAVFGGPRFWLSLFLFLRYLFE